MTIDEMIRRCEEAAELNEEVALYTPPEYLQAGEMERCAETAEEHRQLALWLRELKRLRRFHIAAVESKERLHEAMALLSAVSGSAEADGALRELYGIERRMKEAWL